MASEDPPAYQRIAAEIRERILSGDYPPGSKIPGEKDIREQWGVSTTIAKYTLSLLRHEGLVEGRRGAGHFVREPTRLVRRAHARDMRAKGNTSPFARDSEAAGMQPTWEHKSQRIPAPANIAKRLGIEPGALVMFTKYRFFADERPVQLSDSYEPIAITANTAVELPENGPVVGVVARMDYIGVVIDRFVEEISPRPSTPEEAEALDLDPRGGKWVLAVERTYYAGDTAVETADIVFPGDRYRLIYELPIDPA